jgi:hypothetical protein
MRNIHLVKECGHAQHCEELEPAVLIGCGNDASRSQAKLRGFYEKCNARSGLRGNGFNPELRTGSAEYPN